MLTLPFNLVNDCGIWDRMEYSLTKQEAQLQRLLDQMDAKGYQFWSVLRKDGEFLHFMVKGTRAKNVLDLGTSRGKVWCLILFWRD